MNTKMSVFVIGVEATIYLLYNLHNGTFNACCPLKDHTYLNKPAAQSCGFV